jgi:hypothetical protein
LFCYRERVVDLNPEIPDRALDFCVTQQKLNSAQVSGAPVYQGRLCSAQRVRPEQVRIQANVCYPVRQEPRVLPGCQIAIGLSPASEQVSFRFSARSSQVVIHGLARSLRQLKLDRSACLLLPNHRSIRRITTWRHVINFERHEIAATKLAVDGEVEESKSRTRPST